MALTLVVVQELVYVLAWPSGSSPGCVHRFQLLHRRCTPSSPLIPSEIGILGGASAEVVSARLRPWQIDRLVADLLLVLAATRTAEHPGISAAGSTVASRRFTALADAELMLAGPAAPRHWPLPPLPAGVSRLLTLWPAAAFTDACGRSGRSGAPVRCSPPSTGIRGARSRGLRVDRRQHAPVQSAAALASRSPDRRRPASSPGAE